MGKPLLTFKGWQGQWWKNIHPGTALLDATLTVLPGSGVASSIGKRVAPKLIRAGMRRFFRGLRGSPKVVGVHPGLRTARGGSAITKGALQLGGGKAFRAGGTAFNIRTAAGVGTAGIAAVGVGKAVGIGKVVQPRAAAVAASGAVMPARMLPSSSPSSSPMTSASPSSSPRTSAGAGSPKRCGCPAGQRMLCFKRKHNPEAEAKRRARRKAARESAKAKTAKRTARARAAVARRKSARAARGVRRALRGKRAHR